MNGKVTRIDEGIRTPEMSETHRAATVLHELKDEIGQFLRTRATLLKSELRENLPSLSKAGLLVVVGTLLFLTAYMLFTVALVAVIAEGFRNSEFRWVFALLALGVAWAIFGGISFLMAKHQFTQKNILPKRTLAVLKGDKVWLQQEVKSQ
jgi:uncharacterized membrane protein YqjE